MKKFFVDLGKKISLPTAIWLGLAVITLTSIFLFQNRKSEIRSRWIAHGLGGYEGHAYDNCREWGFRLFEMDFLTSADGHLVGMHDGQEKEFGLTSSFTIQQFKASSLLGTTPLADFDVAELAQKYSDWYLVTDIKTNNLDGLKRLCQEYSKRGVSCAERIIPQLYSPAEVSIFHEIPFKRVIFTLYRFGNHKDEVLRTLDEHSEVWAVTMWADWWNEEYAAELKKRGVLGFVHTVNDQTRAEKLFANGVSGIYTDFLIDDMGGALFKKVQGQLTNLLSQLKAGTK